MEKGKRDKLERACRGVCHYWGRDTIIIRQEKMKSDSTSL